MSDHAPRFGLTIDSPRAGWVDISVSCGAAGLRIRPSYLGDTMGDLALAAAALAERRCGWGGESRFDCQDEPGAWRWRLTPHAGNLHILVERHRDTFPSAAAPGEPVLECETHGRQFCAAVLAALEALLGGTTAERFNEEWRRPYPVAAVERLRAALRSWP